MNELANKKMYYACYEKPRSRYYCTFYIYSKYINIPQSLQPSQQTH